LLWPAFSGRFLAASSVWLVWLGVCQAQTAGKPAGATANPAVTKSAPQPSSAPKHASTPHSAASSQHASTATNHGKTTTTTKSRRRVRTASWRTRGQQKIDPQRAHDIQEALIREHYLDGSSSGVWDDATQKAMQRYQADQGWQSIMTPDSRALIKLGLGPDHAHLLNPESAMTGGGDPPHASEAPAPPVASPSIPVSATPLPAQDSAGQEDPPKK
jgi:hypothetical protein